MDVWKTGKLGQGRKAGSGAAPGPQRSIMQFAHKQSVRACPQFWPETFRMCASDSSTCTARAGAATRSPCPEAPTLSAMVPGFCRAAGG